MTSLDDDIETPINSESNCDKNAPPEVEDTASNQSAQSNQSYELFSCQTCKKDYTDSEEYYTHLVTHVKQPKVVLQRVDDPNIKKNAHKSGPLKFTVKTTNNNFKIIQPDKKPEEEEEKTEVKESELPRIPKLRILLPEQLAEVVKDHKENPTTEFPEADKLQNKDSLEPNMVELHQLPSESQSPSFPTQSPTQPDAVTTNEHANFWNSEQSTNESLQIVQSGEKEAETHNNLLQNFLNDAENSTAKDSIVNSNETEYISLERLAEKNGPQCPVCRERCMDQISLEIHQKATGHYKNRSPNELNNSSLMSSNNNSLIPYGQPPLSGSLPSSPLDNLANLPMQQLAQQVNRLQQGGVHQQNVLINIQQFGQPMGQHIGSPPYGRPDMSPTHYPGPGQHYPTQQPQPPPPPHMYGGFHPPPPPHPHHMMYYPPTSGMYPPMPHTSPNQRVSHPFAPPAPPHTQPPIISARPSPPQQRMAPPPPPPNNQLRPRARMPMQQPRGSSPRMMGPRSAPPSQSNMRPNMPQQIRMQRRPSPATIDPNIPKRKRLDVFLPDTNDNDDCHVISMQKCNDGLPIIKNVQGATSSSDSDPVVHLTDSITLSVRNPKDSPVVQKKNDAKAVANILATRGITVTPAAKNIKESAIIETKKVSQKSASPPVAINLNNAVSIIPTARGAAPNNQQKEAPSNRPPRPPTVDLTNDEPTQTQQKPQMPSNKRTLPHKCFLCPAQYPTLQALSVHRRSYHKTGVQNELGIPIVDLKQTAVLNKLSNLGIHSYIPLPQLSTGSGTYALPIVSVNAVNNPNICNIGALGSGSVLPLGPLRHIANNNK